MTQTRCNALTTTCRKCEYKYSPEDTKNGIMDCPDCGENRKCIRYPNSGKERCGKHGGLAKSGFNNHLYKGKGLTKNLPAAMYQAYINVLETPDATNFAKEIAILDDRLMTLINRVDKTNSQKLWKQLKTVYQHFSNARQARNLPKQEEKLAELENIIIHGYMDSVAWTEISGLTEQIRKLKESENKRREKASKLISHEQFRTLVGYMMESINRHTSNLSERNAIFADMQRLSY